jgi:hypothetical protein
MTIFQYVGIQFTPDAQGPGHEGEEGDGSVKKEE